MRLKMLGNIVLIKPEENKEENKGGIFIPETAKEKPEVGRVVSVGPGKRDAKGRLIPVNSKVGDKVLFHKHTNNEIEFENETYLIMADDKIFGVIEEGE